MPFSDIQFKYIKGILYNLKVFMCYDAGKDDRMGKVRKKGVEKYER